MTDTSGSRDPDLRDVRMRGFSRRCTVEAALEWVDSQINRLGSEQIPLHVACGRVLARDVTSQFDVPGFARSMMDGFAVKANDTLGASAYQPLSLKLIGEAWPGRDSGRKLTSGCAVMIMTGAPLPAGADAVLPAEKVQIEGDRLSALDEVSPGKHVGARGADIQVGTIVFQNGRCLRPQDVGVLSSIGVGNVDVVHRPRVHLIITGNELLPAGSAPTGHQIVDSNGPMLQALVERDGGLPVQLGIVPDEPEKIRAALSDPAADLFLVSGGSSVGQEDHSPTIVGELGELSIHGIAMRPSSPTGMGRIGHRFVFLLPGNPVSCLCAYDFFAGRAIRMLGGRRAAWPYRSVHLPLKRKLVSVVGRVDYARVKVVADSVEPLAISGASILTSTTRADGFVVVPSDNEGYAPGTIVEVYLYES